MMTLVSLLERRASEAPEAVAVSDSEKSFTWAELSDGSRAVAGGLASLGLEHGETVIVQLPNWVENVVLRYALKRCGLVGVYTPITWREREIRQVLEKTGARLYVAPPAFGKLDFLRMSADLAPDFPELRSVFVRGDDGLPHGSSDACRGFAPEDVSLICVSSGSTGAPKLCESREQAQLANGNGIGERFAMTREDVVGIFAPLDGGAGLMGWLMAAASGSPVVLADAFRSESMLDRLARERVTVLATVPALLLRLLDAEDHTRWDLSALRLIRTGTAALFESTAIEAERRLGAKMVPAAGTMEALTYAQTGTEDPEEIRLGGSVGRPLPGNEIRLVSEDGTELGGDETGILETRGTGIGAGYFRDPEATAKAWPNGWFRTGDLAVRDEAGNIFLRGRTKDVISRGGRNIYPAELESFLIEHPGVREVAVVGVPSEALEEKTRAYVVTRDQKTISEEELREFLEHKRIATYKMPDEFRFLPELPRLPGAKVNRRALRMED